VKFYGFWRSLASYRVRVALALKGVHAEEISIDLLKGKQSTPDYLAVNPQGLVPALILDEGGASLFQSVAILEYLEEIRPQPPLLPSDPRGRARVRGLSLIAAADSHPLVVPRVRNYLEREMKQDEAARNRWLAHWTMRALEAIESHLDGERETGRFCHGNTPTMADICVSSQMIGALAYFNCDTKSVPTAMRIYNQCMEIAAFANAHPLKQPGAKTH
jgi:maleylacetoacetate isomerase